MASILLFQGLDDFTINSRGTAVPDDVTLPQFLGLQRAINAYLKKFLPASRLLTVDGKIGASTVTALNAVWTQASIRLETPRVAPFTVQTAAAQAPTQALRIFAMAGARPDFSVPVQPRPESPPSGGGGGIPLPRPDGGGSSGGGTPAPDATSEEPKTDDKGSGAGTLLVAVSAVGIGAWLLATALAGRKR